MHEVPEWLKEILAEPTTTVPNAGRALGGMARNQAYAAAARGEIVTRRYGRRLIVPTAWLRKELMLDDASGQG
jgi:hypothetical protein